LGIDTTVEHSSGAGYKGFNMKFEKLYTNVMVAGGFALIKFFC
jgi:hypothetical protein